MNVLLDTNVVSEWAKPRPNAQVIGWLAQLDEDRSFLSVVTLGESRQGVERLPPSRRGSHLDEWLQHDLPERFGGRILPVDAAVADLWGRLVIRRQRSGRPIAALDAMLAATAGGNDLTLATRNPTDFQGCGIRVFDPWAESPPDGT